MAEFLPLLPCTPLLTQDACAQDSRVPPAEEPSQEAQGGRVQGLAPKRWKLLEVPTIQITPASNEESPPCTPPAQCLQLPRTPCQSGGAPALRPGAIAQSPGREAALAWASLAQRSPASSVLARAGPSSSCVWNPRVFADDARGWQCPFVLCLHPQGCLR